jgi:hypothetical protein
MDPKPTCCEEVAELVDHFMTASAAGDGERKKLHLRTSKEALVMMFDMMIDKAMAKAAQKASGGDVSQAVRLELRELKKAVFVNASDGSAAYTQETQDYMDRADTGWDAILKLAAEQRPVDGLSVSRRVTDLLGIQEDETESRPEAPTSAAPAPTSAAPAPAAAASAASAKTSTKAKDKRQICPNMWAWEFCGGCSGYKHPAVCQDRSHCSRRDRPASCKLWHLNWASNHWRGTTGGSSSGNPRPKHVLSDAVPAAKHEKLKKYVAEMELKNHRRKEDERTQRACVAAVTLSQQQQPQPAQSAWGPPPGSSRPVQSAWGPPPGSSPPPSLLTSSSPPAWAAALMLSFQQLQSRVDSRLGPGH